MDMMVATLERLLHEVADLKHRVANMVQVGPVAHVDAQQGYRVVLGEDRDGNPRLSPWLPHPDSGGANKSWHPLSPDQIVAVIAPGGDLRQGFIVRAGFGGKDPPPSQDAGEVVLLDKGTVRISAMGDAVLIKVGGSRLRVMDGRVEIDATGIVAQGASITHNGREIGDQHVHTKVLSGSDLSGPPQQQ